MRTTVRIDDDLLKDLRRQAVAEGVPLTRLINRLLREALRAAKDRQPRRKFRQKTFDMGEPLVDLSKALQIAGLVEDEQLARRMMSRQ